MKLTLAKIFLTISAVEALNSCPNNRRAFLGSVGSCSAAVLLSSAPEVVNAAGSAPSLNFETSKSGIQWADAKVGTGATPSQGQTVAIDYVLSTTGARYGSSIYKTADKGAPYRWTLGDGSTIKGLEEAIIGGEGMTGMKSGGIRRVVIPSDLAYQKLTEFSEDCGQKNTFGPVPPPGEAFEEFQRFKNIYCNPNRQYQPDNCTERDNTISLGVWELDYNCRIS